MTRDWRPDAWEAWTLEQRRIWRLEQQLRRWEALTFAAREVAHEAAAELSRLKGGAEPAVAEFDRLIFEKARSMWSLQDEDDPTTPPSLEAESQKSHTLDVDAEDD